MIWTEWPTRQYPIILADPPWSWQAWSRKGEGRSAKRYYPVMSFAELAKLPVEHLATKNAALFLWAVPPNLKEALQLIGIWGFEYKTWAFTYVKLNRDGTPFMGMGYYTRANAEPCLLATRGKSLSRLDRGVPQVILAPRREHSRKPDEQYERIERLYGPDLPKLELFARHAWPGWDCWGLDVGSARV